MDKGRVCLYNHNRKYGCDKRVLFVKAFREYARLVRVQQWNLQEIKTWSFPIRTFPSRYEET